MRRQPRHKLSRRFGFDVFGTGGAQLARRMERDAAGARRRRSRRRSDYGDQLTEKQKARAIYGVSESQFRRYFEAANSRPGNTGENLLLLLERRLDNVVYRLGFARSRPMARQLVSHGHVAVDGQRVTIPSFRVETGQRLTLTRAAAKIPAVAEELAANRPLPAWLARDGDGTAGHVERLPERTDVELPIDESLITSFYSR